MKIENKNHTENIDGFRRLIALLGIAIVVVGGLVLFYLGVLIMDVINDPEEVKIIEFVLQQVKADEAIATGQFGNESFKVAISESFRLILFLFIGVLFLSVIAGIIRTIIGGGINIVKAAFYQYQEDAEK